MKALLLVALSIFAFQAQAQDKYVCKSGNSERVIEVVYTNPDSSVPCEVHYTKASETEVLWQASHEKGYCETKAQAFAEKLTSLGIPCTAASSDESISHKSMTQTTAESTAQPQAVEVQAPVEPSTAAPAVSQ
ncbi:hypothetical protein [Photobacterium damselae]|uniref:hypothetical protein n=1 Tax=Photobacterium damselae TaxID=38293 RepID=UPI000D6602A4|nr:hypothetical protein [Photobacterium damselae]AWK84315.1 hypothetical protein BST98_20320 [Photobacterium damselae]